MEEGWMDNSVPECCTDYVSFVDEESFALAERADAGKEYRLLLAVFCGSVRLLDNMKMSATG